MFGPCMDGLESFGLLHCHSALTPVHRAVAKEVRQPYSFWLSWEKTIAETSERAMRTQPDWWPGSIPFDCTKFNKATEAQLRDIRDAISEWVDRRGNPQVRACTPFVSWHCLGILALSDSSSIVYRTLCFPIPQFGPCFF
jgi:hypothetical protein